MAGVVDPPASFPTTQEYFECDLSLLQCNKCGQVPPTASRLDGEFQLWAAQLSCDNCRGLPFFFMCRICPQHGLFQNRKQKLHIRCLSKMRKHSISKTHTKAMVEFMAMKGQAETSLPSQLHQEPDQEDISAVARRPVHSELVNTEEAQDDDEPNNDFLYHGNDDDCTEMQEEASLIEMSVEQRKLAWLQELKENNSRREINFQNCFPDDVNSYFELTHRQPCLGAQHLVGRAFHGGQASQVHPCTALYGLQFCRLSDNLSTDQFEALASILDFMQNPPTGPEADCYPPAPIPTSPREMRQFFTTGKDSIKMNLPIPPIHYYRNKTHVYISPLDCLRDLLGHGRHVDPMFPGASVHARSPRGQELMDKFIVDSADSKQCFLIPLYPWNDDIDPNNVKGNRHKVWVQMITFAPPEARIHKSHNTYLIAMGSGDKEHGVIETKLQKHLAQLAAGVDVYHGGLKCLVRCYCYVYAHMADRPAKAQSTYTLSGTSPSHACFGLSGILPSNLPSCELCFQRRQTATSCREPCSDCFDWVPVGAEYDCPRNYPDPPPSGCLSVKRITFQSMGIAVETAYGKVLLGDWKKQQCRTYLKTEGLPASLADELYEHAKERAAYWKAQDKQTFLQEHTANNQAYYDEKFIPPAPWSHPMVEVRDWVTTIMHQLFLGIVKATFGEDLVKLWLTSNKKASSFVHRTNISITRGAYLKLTWLKLEPLSKDGKTGRFVSENYLAFERVSKWLYSDLGQVTQQDEEYNDPVNKELAQYSRTQLTAWLKARRIQFASAMRKDELLALAYQMVEANGGQWPMIIPEDRVDASFELAEDLIAALLAMTSRIMIKGDISERDAHDCDRHVKLFLSLVNKFDQTRRNTTSTNTSVSPIYLAKYNFISLLSIPECMLHHGSLRLLWEGDGKGEGSLPEVKASIVSLKGDWAKNAADRWYRQRQLARVTESLVLDMNNMGIKHNLLDVATAQMKSENGTTDKEWNESARNYQKNYHVYKKKRMRWIH